MKLSKRMEELNAGDFSNMSSYFVYVRFVDMVYSLEQSEHRFFVTSVILLVGLIVMSIFGIFTRLNLFYGLVL